MAVHPVLADDRLTAIGLLFEAHDGVLRRLSPQLQDHGLPQGEFEALLRLARTPGERLRMTDLASQLRLSTSGATRLVDRLQSRNLVSREACPDDGRGSFAVLTAEGRAIVVETVKGHVELIDQWYTGLLEPDELAALSAALRKIRDVVHPHAAAGSTPTT